MKISVSVCSLGKKTHGIFLNPSHQVEFISSIFRLLRIWCTLIV